MNGNAPQKALRIECAELVRIAIGGGSFWKRKFPNPFGGRKKNACQMFDYVDVIGHQVPTICSVLRARLYQLDIGYLVEMLGNENNRSNFSSSSSPVTSPQIAIIDDIFPRDNNFDSINAMAQLDKALEEKYPIIVIEPKTLGEQTSRWIEIGNMLHRSSVLLSIGSIVTVFSYPKATKVWCCTCSAAAVCLLLYWFGWSSDPCSHYRLETDLDNVAKLELGDSRLKSAVVLVYRNDFPRRRFQRAIVTIASAVVVMKRMNIF
uniref:Uncharacterized protein n=1 Tax=Trichuris muris TaxID=70415 RepID=A0A5S6PZA5_TRIMR